MCVDVVTAFDDILNGASHGEDERLIELTKRIYALVNILDNYDIFGERDRAVYESIQTGHISGRGLLAGEKFMLMNRVIMSETIE